MPTIVKHRRGTTAQNAAFTGASGEISIDLDKKTLLIHDSATAGGFEMLSRNLTNQTIAGNMIPAADSTYSLGDSAAKWKNLYLSGNTIYLGDATISATGTAVTLPAGSTVAGTGFTLDSAGIYGILSAGTGVTYDGAGQFSIGQPVDSSANVNFATIQTTGNVTIGGDLTINGTTTTINSTTLDVDDLNITVAKGAADGTAANGAGLTVDGANATISYTSATDTWDFNKAFGTNTNVISNYTTDQLSEGDNLYYTTARADSDFDVRLTTKSTTNLTEGSNLYYTRARFDSALGDTISQATIRGYFSAAGDLSYNSSTGEFSFDVENVYTQDNFDSDFNTSLDAAAIGGKGLSYNTVDNTLSIDSGELYAQYKHDGFNDYVADEHVAHSGVTITAGAGLTGGGDITTSRTINVVGSAGVVVNADNIAIDSAHIRGLFSGSAGVNYNSSTGAFDVDEANVSHDDLSGFVADEHVAHTSVTITAGRGLSGGGDISASRTINLDSAEFAAYFNTANLPEGTNLYYTTARADSDAKHAISGSTGITYSSTTGVITTNDGQIVHDNLSGFVADEHVDHTGVTLTAGVGLNGGGDISLNRTFNIDSAELYASFAHDDFHDYVADEHIAHSTVSITAGSGLTGGGTIAASRTINIGQGTGITVGADAISTNDSEIVHDNLSGFVADEHVAHSGVTITAGSGLTGGGDITTSRTLNVGAGTGVTVNADNVAIGQDVATTANVTFNSVTTTDGLIVGGNLQVTGTTTTVNSQTLEVTDNMIYMNAGESDGSPVQSIDVGWAANVNDGGSYEHVGMFRDATDDRFKVFKGYTPEPDAALEINTGHASFALADFQAATFHGNLTGDVTGNASTATTLQTTRTIGGVSFNGSANIDLPGVNTTGNQNTTGSAATLTTGRDFSISGDITASAVSFNGSGNVTLSAAITAGSIVNADINASAAIADTKLATISTSGKVANSATTATSANTASAIVARDGNGDFTARHVTLASGDLKLDEYVLNSQTATTTSTSQTAVATFAAATYGSAEIVVTAKDGTARHISKLLVVHNGTTADATEFGTITTGSSLATYTVDINGGNVRLLATPATANSTVFNVALTLIDA